MLSTYSSSSRSRPSQTRWYKSSARPALAAKPGSRGKIHDRYRHGRIASSSSHRHTVDRATDSTRPSAWASAARSAADHRDCGTRRSSGGSHAIALTSATTAAGNTRGRPGRLRSPSPSRPSRANRPRHLLTTFTCTSSRAAICVFSSPSAASSTILARTTTACGNV